MADNKTKPTVQDPAAFIAAVSDPRQREEAEQVDAMMRRVTGLDPTMWGPSIIGYGSYHYRYATGREGDMCRIGFSPRKAEHSIYLMGLYCDEATQAEANALFERLGRHRRGKSCLYIRKLADVDLGVLEQLASLSWQAMERLYPRSA